MKTRFAIALISLVLFSCENNDDTPPTNERPDPVIDEAIEPLEENPTNELTCAWRKHWYKCV